MLNSALESMDDRRWKYVDAVAGWLGSHGGEDAGHEIGLHGYSHENPTELSREQGRDILARFFGDPRAATARTARSNRAPPTGVVPVDGDVAGHWRRRVTEAVVAIEVVTYDPPTAADARALQLAAAELGRFLGREATLQVSAS